MFEDIVQNLKPVIDNFVVNKIATPDYLHKGFYMELTAKNPLRLTQNEFHYGSARALRNGQDVTVTQGYGEDIKRMLEMIR